MRDERTAMKIRMKDIARDLGVSVITVSKALGNRGDISAETRQRVLKRMKELNYWPNPAARTLATGLSYMIGIVVPDLVHPFFAQVAKGASRILRQKGYSLIISSSEDDADLEKQEIEHMLAGRLDGLIIASAQWTVESFRRIEEAGTPYVLVDRSFRGLPANFIGIDDKAAGGLATEHLIEIGCRMIAHIGGRDVSTALDRREGYRQALAARGMAVLSEYDVCVTHGDDSGDIVGYKTMQALLSLTPRPDGVFCYNDPIASGAMHAIIESGLRIPEDVALVGCGNVQYAPLLRVPLTSIHQDSLLLGEQAAELILSLAGEKGAVRPRTIVMQPALIRRQSTARGREGI